MDIYIFDFDGTLMRTPEETPSWWKDPAPFSWHSNPVSLSPPVVPSKPSGKHWISWVAKEAKRSLQDPNAKVFLVTARVSSMRQRILEILKSKGIVFDGTYFNPGTDASSYKKKVFQDIQAKYPNPQEVHIFEDNHLNAYVPALEKMFPFSKVFGHGVKDSQHPIEPEGIPQDLALRVADRYLNRRY
jgi:hypothetical protein